MSLVIYISGGKWTRRV